MFWAISSACARSSATSSTRWRSTWAGARPGVRRRRTGACIPAWQSQARWGDTGCLGAGCTQRQLLTALRRTQACAYISATSAGAGCLERMLRFSRHVALDVAASGYEARGPTWGVDSRTQRAPPRRTVCLPAPLLAAPGTLQASWDSLSPASRESAHAGAPPDRRAPPRSCTARRTRASWMRC